MSAGRRKSGLPKTPAKSSAPTEISGECLQLQQELDTLRQVHASIHALNEMTINLHKTLRLVVKNSHDLKGLNEGWQIFFGQK